MQTVFLALAGLVLLLAWCMLTQGKRPSSACPLRHNSCRVHSLLQLAPQAHGMAVPLSYQHGVYEVDLWVGGHPVRAVLDTGSERLIIAGDGCVRNSACTGAGGVYHTKPGHPRVESTTIAYGTQKDHVHWVTETLGLPAVSTQNPCSLLWGEKASQKVEVEMEVGIVHHREGDTNLNVMGFCPALGAPTNRTLLHVLLGDRPVFGLLLEDKRGWLILGGGMSRCLPLQAVPLVSFRNYKYLMVKVQGVNIVDDTTGERRACHPAPRYAILDSGSNMLSVSTPLFQDMNLDPGRRHQVLEIDLGDGCVQTYHYPQYCMQQQLLVRDNLPFATEHQDDIILLGSLFMRQQYVEFDLGEKVVRFGKLSGRIETSTPAPLPRTKKTYA